MPGAELEHQPNNLGLEMISGFEHHIFRIFNIY